MSADSQDFSKVYFQKITRNLFNGSKISRSKIGLKMAIFLFRYLDQALYFLI